MNLDTDNPSFPDEGKHGESAICNCPCQHELASLRKEISKLKKLLENSMGGSSIQPAAKNPPLDVSVPSEDAVRIASKGSEGSAATASSESVNPSIELSDVALRKIGSYLPLTDLLEFRLVCKSWKTAASSVLRMRSTYVRFYTGDFAQQILCTHGNSDFPFSGYLWRRVSQVDEEDMRNFLTECSHVFKSLRLSYYGFNFNFATKFVNDLKTHFSHVEVLDMSTVLSGPKPLMTTQELSQLISYLEQLKLPKLEVLWLPFVCPTEEDNNEIQVFIEALIKAAPKLRRIFGFVPSLTAALESARKMDAVTTMELRSYELASPFMRVALNPPCQLSKLVVDDCSSWRRDAVLQNAAWGAFVAVLRASRETLESLSMEDTGAQLRGLQPFLKLKHLHIKGNSTTCPETYRLFPEDVSDLFPVLKAVTVELDYWHTDDIHGSVTQYDVLRLFLWDKPLPSVTSLEIHFALDLDGIYYFEDIFPNVTRLWIDWEKCYRKSNGEYRERNLREIWEMSFNLERLEIHRFNPWASNYFSLDSFITGIHESVCRNLRQAESQQLPMESSYYRYLRGHANILSFQETLRELIISVDYPPTLESQSIMTQDEEDEDSIVSTVSVVYGTKLMTNKLQLYLVYDHRKFYSSAFEKFFAPIRKDAIITHQEFPNPLNMPL